MTEQPHKKMQVTGFDSDEDREKFADWIMSYEDDPYGWVLACYPWGEPGTTLEKYRGPDAWQRKLLMKIGGQMKAGKKNIRISTSSGHGAGKLHCNEIIVPTPKGMVRWGDIEPGDFLFGDDGTPTKVIGKHPQKDWEFYRITFNDGSYTYCGKEHLWQVKGRQERRKGLDTWRVLSLGDIIKQGVKRPNGAAQARQWEIPTQGSVEFEPRETKIHPYLMGIWIGDGSVNKPAYTKPYLEIKERIESFGYEIHTGKDGKTQRVQGITKLLTDPVFRCKSPQRYIPDDYKFNTIECRMELFKGLCDSDGEVCGSKGTVGYSSTSKRLINDVVWLARSLGCRASLQPAIKHAWYPHPDTGERVMCNQAYRLTINTPFNPFTVRHKKERFKESEARYAKRWIDSIEFSHAGDGHCVTVEANNGLYQCNDFIVTHNTAVSAWIIHWFISTHPNPQLVVTANTRIQLSTKTWRELAKWKNMAVNGFMFNWTATSYRLIGREDTWYASAIPWSAHNPDAFQGTHETNVMMLFDEASGIDNSIFVASEGAFTSHGGIWLLFGNCTRNSGAFFENTFGRSQHRWDRIIVDTRKALMRSDELIKQWIEDWGIDSDFVRVRVLGLPPKQGDLQLISTDVVRKAVERKVELHEISDRVPKLMGVDVARQGTDFSKIIVRQGRKMHDKIWTFNERDTSVLALHVSKVITDTYPDVVFVDGVGIGAGVVDMLRRLGHDNVIEVQAGSKPSDQKLYWNKRIEMWDRMRAWLEGADIPDSPQLFVDLTTPQYGFETKSDRMKLESKDDMRARGCASPDEGDALAQTFYHMVPSKTQFISETSYEPEVC